MSSKRKNWADYEENEEEFIGCEEELNSQEQVPQELE